MTEVSQVIQTSSNLKPAQVPAVSKAWNEGLPNARSQAQGISPDAVAEMIKGPDIVGRDFIVIDLRKDDFKGHAIRGAVNLPANSFFALREGNLALLSSISKVIFHCQRCAGPQTRGQMCAAYYQDELNSATISTSKAYFLEGGIQEWVEKYRGNKDLVVDL